MDRMTSTIPLGVGKGADLRALLPCPFCNAPQAADEHDTTGVWVEKNDHDEPEYQVVCWSCGAKSKEFNDREQATSAWNQRNNASALLDEIAHSERVISGLNKQLTEQFKLSTKYVAIAERYRAALEIISFDDVPRPVGTHWRADGKPTKNDRCEHGMWMYESCGECISDFASQALSQSPSQGEES